MPPPYWLVSLGQAKSKLIIVQQNLGTCTHCKSGPVHIQRRIPPSRTVRPREERKHVHTTSQKSLGSWEQRSCSLPLLGGGAVGGGGRRELAGPGVGWTFELNLGEGQNLKWRQEQERQEQESRQNKELREKNTEKSVREQKKTGLMQRVRGDSV